MAPAVSGAQASSAAVVTGAALATSAAVSAAGVATLQVDNVKSVDDLLALQGLLRQLAVITQSNVSSMTGDTVIFTLQPEHGCQRILCRVAGSTATGARGC